MKVRWRTFYFLLLTICLAAIGFLALSGCGEEDTAATATAAAATGVASADDDSEAAVAVNIYVEQVRDSVRIGDQLNASYRDLVERYNIKEASAEDVIATAQQNAIAYQDMTAQLERMTVPGGLDAAHAMIVSGFGKWERMYILDARGLQDENSELLAQARALDSEAVAEVNEAISEINRLKD